MIFWATRSKHEEKSVIFLVKVQLNYTQPYRVFKVIFLKKKVVNLDKYLNQNVAFCDRDLTFQTNKDHGPKHLLIYLWQYFFFLTYFICNNKVNKENMKNKNNSLLTFNSCSIIFLVEFYMKQPFIPKIFHTASTNITNIEKLKVCI